MTWQNFFDFESMVPERKIFFPPLDFLGKFQSGFLIQGVSKKGNPTLACHCALITGCMNVIFAWS